MKRSLIVDTHASSCYFRTSMADDRRKALIQVTERCDLHCAHCFVSSMKEGLDMDYEDIVSTVIPQLQAARVERITLTGGEPVSHPRFMDICRAVSDAGCALGICTNGTQSDDAQIAELATLPDVHVNISLDGFRRESHGKFRGDKASFDVTVETARKFAGAGLLQGFLSTPNMLTEPQEFADLCAFAAKIGAQYVLMNPLSSFGRGVKSQGRMAADEKKMRAIAAVTKRFDSDDLDVVQIRFPNDDLPLGGCDVGKLIYVYADGHVAACPYLVFAARTPQSKYSDSEFLVGNILEDDDVVKRLDAYDFHSRYAVGDNPTCGACAMNSSCGKGCPAAVITNGGRIGDVDAEQCPVGDEQHMVSDGVRLLPLAVRS
ncbi:MAG: radical SAM protein [Stackebrandtia sp.]